MAAKKTGLTDLQKSLYKKLNPLQKLTANNYLKTNNGKQSYISACKKLKRKIATGSRSAANQILTRTDVKAYVDSVKGSVEAEDADSTIMTREESLRRLTSMARGSIDDLIEFGTRIVGEDDDGNDIEETSWHFKDSAQITPQNLALINEISSGNGGLKLKIHDQRAALKQLAQLQGWDSAQKFDVNAKVDGRFTVIIKDLTGAKGEES